MPEDKSGEVAGWAAKGLGCHEKESELRFLGREEPLRLLSRGMK